MYETNFDAPDAHFDYLNLFIGTRPKKKNENPKKKKIVKTVQERKNPNIVP
jgi:hypothetical protein